MSRDRLRSGAQIAAHPRGLAAALALLGASCAGPLRHEPLARTERPLEIDGDLALAASYAPYVYHAVHPSPAGRQDIPTRVDFDGNLRGDEAWESFPRFELPPTLYYAVVETETHAFLTWSARCSSIPRAAGGNASLCRSPGRSLTRGTRSWTARAEKETA